MVTPKKINNLARPHSTTQPALPGALLRNLLVLILIGAAGCAAMPEGVSVTSQFSTTESGRVIPKTSYSCRFPFEPAGFMAFWTRYHQAMHYLTFAPNKTCRGMFAEELRKVTRDAFYLPAGCVEATFNDIDDALHHPEELNKRLRYY